MSAAPWRRGDEAEWGRARVAAALLASTGGMEGAEAPGSCAGKAARAASVAAMALAFWSLASVWAPDAWVEVRSTSLTSSLASVALSLGVAWTTAVSSARVRARMVMAAAGHRWALLAVAAGSAAAPSNMEPDMAARIVSAACAARAPALPHLAWLCAKESALFGDMAVEMLARGDAFEKAYALVAFCSLARPGYRAALRRLDRAEPGHEEAEALCAEHFPAEHARWAAEEIAAGLPARASRPGLRL